MIENEIIFQCKAPSSLKIVMFGRRRPCKTNENTTALNANYTSPAISDKAATSQKRKTCSKNNCHTIKK